MNQTSLGPVTTNGYCDTYSVLNGSPDPVATLIQPHRNNAYTNWLRVRFAGTSEERSILVTMFQTEPERRARLAAIIARHIDFLREQTMDAVRESTLQITLEGTTYRTLDAENNGHSMKTLVQPCLSVTLNTDELTLSSDERVRAFVESVSSLSDVAQACPEPQ